MSIRESSRFRGAERPGRSRRRRFQEQWRRSRNSIACTSSDVRPISSKKTVPPAAARKWPGWQGPGLLAHQVFQVCPVAEDCPVLAAVVIA